MTGLLLILAEAAWTYAVVPHLAISHMTVWLERRPR